jgi:hypothetical protein
MNIILLLCSTATFPLAEKIGELYSRSYSDGKIYFPTPMELDCPSFVPVDMREAGMKGACQSTSPKSRSAAKSNKWVAYPVSLSGWKTGASLLTLDIYYVDGLAYRTRRETQY